jgi:hypothetical protein
LNPNFRERDCHKSVGKGRELLLPPSNGFG